MKKFLSLVLALVMTMSLVTVSAGAKDFTDSTKIQYTEAVDVMSAVKVIDGYADGSFNPSATLTRGAAAKIICNLIPVSYTHLVVLTQVERTAAVNLVRQMFEENPEYASVLFKTGIRKGSAVPESTIAAVPVVRYAKKSNPSVCLLYTSRCV